MITPWSSVIDTSSTSKVEHTATAASIFAESTRIAKPNATISSYTDGAWDLQPLSVRTSTPSSVRIEFRRYSPVYRATAKRIAWCLINLRTPIEKLPLPKQGTRERLAPRTITQIMNELLPAFFAWSLDHGVEDVSSVRTKHLRAYVEYLQAQKYDRNRIGRMLFAVSRVWLLSIYLPVNDRLVMPPWETDGLEAYLGKYVSTAENKTPPIHPQTMSSLLVWAERFAFNFADDIIVAANLRNEIRCRARLDIQAGDVERFRDFARGLISQGTPLPGYTRRAAEGETWLAQELISGTLGVGTRSMVPEIRRSIKGFDIGTTAPLPLEIRGRIDGDEAPWIPFIDYYEARKLRARVAIACFIITAYLSGMRGQEVLQLRRGCVQTEEQPELGQKRFSIRGLEFKSATDEDGNLIPEGRIRDRPWYILEPVARAIAIAESLSDSEYVFDAGQFVETGPETRHTSAHHGRINQSLEEFMQWVNDYCTRTGRPHEVIPDDPHGRVTPTRFRRTLAWFIFRLPGGRIALGVQYGHLRGFTSEGYGSRSAAGLEGVFSVEETISIADNLSAASERLRSGEAVSGPATSRYIEGINEFEREFAGKVLTRKQMAALRRNPRLRIYENGAQAVACCYDATKALCHPDNRQRSSQDRTPDLTRCNPRCGNVARTDTHIATIREEVLNLKHESTSEVTPEPLRQRIQQRIEALEKLVNQHENTKVSE